MPDDSDTKENAAEAMSVAGDGSDPHEMAISNPDKRNNNADEILDLEPHELCLLPDMECERFAELVADIASDEPWAEVRPKDGWSSGYDDTEVKRIARRYDKGGVPEGFFAALDARQAKLFRDACPNRQGKKPGAA